MSLVLLRCVSSGISHDVAPGTGGTDAPVCIFLVLLKSDCESAAAGAKHPGCVLPNARCRSRKVRWDACEACIGCVATSVRSRGMTSIRRWKVLAPSGRAEPCVRMSFRSSPDAISRASDPDWHFTSHNLLCLESVTPLTALSILPSHIFDYLCRCRQNGLVARVPGVAAGLCGRSVLLRRSRFGGIRWRSHNDCRRIWSVTVYAPHGALDAAFRTNASRSPKVAAAVHTPQWG